MARLRVRVDATPLLVDQESGVSKFCRSLLAALGRSPNVETSAFAVTWRRLDQLGAQVPTGTPVGGRPMPARPLRAAWHRVAWPPVEWFVGPADVIHGTNFVVPPTARAARVVTVHDLTPVKYPELCDPSSLVFADFVRQAVQQGASIHTHSRYVAEEVIDVFGADPARVKPIWSGIPEVGAAGPDGPADPPGRRSPVVLPDGIDRFILAIGTVEPRKDYPGLVRAFDRVAARRDDVALVIIGSDGWGATALAEAMAPLAHGDRIIRLGYVVDTDLLCWLRAAAVLAYPSRYEGFGFPPLLAMLLGVPVVATRAGAVPEVVGDAAALVPSDDVDALAETLGAVLDDAKLAAGLRAAGAARVGLFTWDRCAAEMIDLYRAAAEAGASPPGRGARRRRP